jgi:hypothetical protein
VQRGSGDGPQGKRTESRGLRSEWATEDIALYFTQTSVLVTQPLPFRMTGNFEGQINLSLVTRHSFSLSFSNLFLPGSPA